MENKKRDKNGWYRSKPIEERKAYTRAIAIRSSQKYKNYSVKILREDAAQFDEKCKELGITATDFFREQVNRFLKGY